MKLPKTYEPQQYEPNIYALWESANSFSPKSTQESRGNFSIVMPPPNANGNLHMGHALMSAVEDILTRYHRLKGESTVYIPGADHAGFETWVVFEKQLEKQGKSRFDYSREELYQKVWDFVAQNRGNMEMQLRELGTSADWSKLVFTLDENVINTTYQTFKKLWDQGLIYRGKRLVNYCTKHQTGFSDIEVEYSDQTTPLYYMKYGPFVLATTRPETKFGDTGVAVHPGDKRYKQYVGQEIEVEGVNGPFKVKVVADHHVDPEFGTGAVKVTPAHDFNDWEIGERHNLPAIQVIDENGLMNDKAGRFAGMTVLEARKAVVEALKEKGLLVKVDQNYKNRVGVCYKCKTTIEPMLMDQWFVSMKPLAEPAIKAIKEGKVKFYPKSKGQALINYLKEIKDWNISRQIPWGIPIPAFQNVKDKNDWIFDTDVSQETITKDGKTYQRDPDTFDTWFSSGQWPFITTQHNQSSDLSEYYPTSVMETGHDILYPWVSRMIMLGLYITNKVPFKDVYLHGLVLDEHGQKMSKSKGNVINPQEMIKTHGSDALRMGLVANRSAGMNQAFTEASVIAGRNFSNKLWNIARLVEDKIGNDYQDRQPNPQTIADHWILEKLNREGERIAKLLESYRLSEAYETMYHLIWNDVADWYIESSKINLNKPVLAYVLETILKLAHPFAPFVTETIWQTLTWEKTQLISSSWPDSIKDIDTKKSREFSNLQSLITEARYVANEIGHGKQTLLFTDDSLINSNQDLIKHLASLKDIQQVESGRGIRLATVEHPTWLDIDKETLNKHIAKLNQRIEDINNNINNLEVRLSNKRYVDNAPQEIVQQTRDQLKEQQTVKSRLERELEIIK